MQTLNSKFPLLSLLIPLLLLPVSLVYPVTGAMNGAAHIIGSPEHPVVISYTSPVTISSSLTGIQYAVGGTSVNSILDRVSRKNKLDLRWQDGYQSLWWPIAPCYMKRMSVVDLVDLDWWVYLAAEDQYDGPTRSFNWNGPAASWVLFFPFLTSLELLPNGAPSILSPGVVVGNTYDRGIWIILYRVQWFSPAGLGEIPDPEALAARAQARNPDLKSMLKNNVTIAPFSAPKDFLAIFVKTGQGTIRVDTTYPTAWERTGLRPWHALDSDNPNPPPWYQAATVVPWAPYTAGDTLLFMDSVKTTRRFTYNQCAQGTQFVYIAPDDGSGTTPFLYREKKLKALVKAGQVTTVRGTLKAS